MKLNFVSVKLNFVSVKLNFVSVKLNFVSVKLNFASVKLNFASVKLNFASVKLNFVSVKLNFVCVKLNFVCLKLNFVCEKSTWKWNSILIKLWSSCLIACLRPCVRILDTDWLLLFKISGIIFGLCNEARLNFYISKTVSMIPSFWNKILQ